MNKQTTPHRPYKLEPYNPIWVQEFEKRAEILKSIFGSELLSVDHMGSTSIPDMFAKPQIDILVVVKNLEKVKDFYSAMEKAGFKPMGTEYVGIGDEYFTENSSDGTRLSGVHVFEKGHFEINETLNFRNYLRANKSDRDLYSSTKKSLYERNPENIGAYGSGKGDVIQEIKARATQWAREQL